MRYLLVIAATLAATALMSITSAEADPGSWAAVKNRDIDNKTVQTVGYARRRARRCYLFGYCPPVYGVYPPPAVYVPPPAYTPPPPAYVYPAPVYPYPAYRVYPRRYW